MRAAWFGLGVAVLVGLGCQMHGGADGPRPLDAGANGDAVEDGSETRRGRDTAPSSPDETETTDGSTLPYAASVVDFSPGSGAGYGRERFPEVVLGPPDGARRTTPATNVLSLGDGGTITVAFGGRQISNGEGFDFIVFENPFEGWSELGEVSVSKDGDTWKSFSCDPDGGSEGRWPGCAGWRETLEYDPKEIVPPDPALTGGDAFDLEKVGLETARYVRIRSLSDKGSAGEGNVGFDLDAVGIVHPIEK